MPGPTTRIAHHTAEAIYVRGASLVDELIGKLTFTEMMYFQLMGDSMAVVSRAADLVGHIREEQVDPSARQIWDAASSSIPYKGN